MPVKELARRKAALVDELNTFIAVKKTQAQLIQSKQELLGASPMASSSSPTANVQGGKMPPKPKTTKGVLKHGSRINVLHTWVNQPPSVIQPEAALGRCNWMQERATS